MGLLPVTQASTVDTRSPQLCIILAGLRAKVPPDVEYIPKFMYYLYPPDGDEQFSHFTERYIRGSDRPSNLSNLTQLVNKGRTSLVVTVDRIWPVQGTWVRLLVREDSTSHGTIKSMCHNYRASTLGPLSATNEPMLQLLKPVRLETILC